MDIAYLKNLLGSEEMALRFLEIFREQAPKELAAIRQCAEIGDWNGANIAAHGLKSQLRYLGLTALSDLAYNIETSTETGQIDWETLAQLEGGMQSILPQT